MATRCFWQRRGGGRGRSATHGRPVPPAAGRSIDAIDRSAPPGRRRQCRLPLAAGALLVLAGAGCSSAPPTATVGTSTPSPATPVPGSAVPTPSTVPPRLEPTSAEELGIELDPDGRPYDGDAGIEDHTAETRPLTTLHVLDGQLRIMDGSAIQVDPSFFADRATEIDLGELEELAVSIVWQQTPAGGTVVESVLGVRLQADGTEVRRWGPFEPAYVTDGGTGGVTSQAVIERAEETLGDGESLIPDPDFDAAYEIGDHDGQPGADTLIFVNGFGDGEFPLARGVDADDELVAVMIWDPRFPWRRAVPDGTPPPDVTEREDQLQGCIDGTREINECGICSI